MSGVFEVVGAQFECCVFNKIVFVQGGVFDEVGGVTGLGEDC